jgi:hypothetical protein
MLYVCCPHVINKLLESCGDLVTVSAKFSAFWSLTTPIRQRLVGQKAECVNSVFSGVWDAFPDINLGSYHYAKMNSHTASLMVSSARSVLETEHRVCGC